MFKKFLIFSLFSGLAFSNEQTLKELSEKLSGEYHHTLDLDRSKLDLIQRVEVKDCEVKIETKNYSGIISRDNYDLTILNVFKRVIDFKNTKILAFGTKSIRFHRTFLHFNTEEEREPIYQLFKNYANLCKVRSVRKQIRESREVEDTSTPKFVGRIPVGIMDNAGSVFTENDNIELTLLRGDNSFLERYNAIRNAKKSIYLEQLFIRGDQAGMLFAEEAIKKRMEGLEVKVMVTALFNIISNKDFKVDMDNATIVLRNMMAAGIRVHGFGCKGFLDNEVRGLDLFKLLRPSHVKNWIIDGEDPTLESSISISGGINVSSRYFMLGKRMQWLDQDIGAKGPILYEMHNAFLRNFYDREIHYETYKDDDLCLNPFDPIEEKNEYLKFKQKNTKEYLVSTDPLVLAEKEYISKNIERILRREEKNGEKLLPVKWKKVKGARYVLQRPDEGENFLLKTYVDLINSAKEEISIANVFALFVPEMKLALRKAAARGVKIRILTNDPTNDTGNPLTNTLSRFYYRDLVYENHPDLPEAFDPSLNFPTDQIVINEWIGKIPGEKKPEIQVVMHSKFMIVDKTVGLVGSFNMDNASLHNLEQAVLFESEELAKDLEDLFEKDLKYSHQLTLDEINSFKSPKGYRLMLWFGKLLEPRL
jgi:phosphatidylserine/phosphatidylglycerophosphate/cardiolipin synthase-like enzyme